MSLAPFTQGFNPHFPTTGVLADYTVPYHHTKCLAAQILPKTLAVSLWMFDKWQPLTLYLDDCLVFVSHGPSDVALAEGLMV